MSFLQDRVHGQYAIPRLAIIICERALGAATDPLIQLPLSESVLQFDCQQFAG